MRRRLAALAVALPILILGAACATPPPARRDVVIGLAGEPASVFDDDPSARVLAAAVTETLVRRDAHDELVARLAERVPTLENGGLQVIGGREPGDQRLVATFTLRSGAKWQDGEPITAADVVFAHEQGRAAPAGTEARVIADRIERVDSIDDRTARVTYRAGEWWDAYALGPRVMPRHVLANASDRARASYAREPVHAGPFAVAAWQPGFGVTLSAFKDYVFGAPALGRLEVRFFPDRAALIEALRRGEVDVAPWPSLEADLGAIIDRFADGSERARLQALYTPSESVAMLRFGPRSAFADGALRHAVELAVDRQRISTAIFGGRARIPSSYLVPPLWAADDESPVRPDVAAARGLLARAGFAPGRFGIQERGGDRLTATLLVAPTSAGRVDAARLIAGDLAAVGIAVDVRERPAAEIDAAIGRGGYDLALVDLRADDPLIATDAYVGQEIAKGWFDVLARAARGAATRSERRALYSELQRLWAEEAAGLPVYQILRVDVAPRALGAVRPPAHTGALTWNAAEWSFGAP